MDVLMIWRGFGVQVGSGGESTVRGRCVATRCNSGVSWVIIYQQCNTSLLWYFDPTLMLQAALAMLPLDYPLSSPPSGGTGNTSSAADAKSWDSEATPLVSLALRAESLVLSSCRLWCPPRPWSLLRAGGAQGKTGGFLHRVSAHALACPANHMSGGRLLAALLPHESPAPLHRLGSPVATAAAAAAGVAAAATTAVGGGTDGGAASGGQQVSLERLVGRVHTAAALEQSEGLRRQAVAALERRVCEVLNDWDVCIAGDVFPPRETGNAADGNGGEGSGKESGDEGGGGHSANGERYAGGAGWRPLLTANPLLAVTAPEVVNVPAVVVTLCHTASPMLQQRVHELARR